MTKIRTATVGLVVRYILAFLIFSPSVSALMETPEGLYYRVLHDYSAIEITGCNKRLVGTLAIPAEIDGKPVVSIGLDAPGYSTAFTNCIIPYTVTQIHDSAFIHGRNLQAFEVAVGNPEFFTIDGVLYNKDGKTLLRCPPATHGVFEVPDDVTSIGIHAFSGCENLTNIVLPYSLVYIGESAFFQCKNLRDLKIPDSVVEIGTSAFWSCDALTTIFIPQNVSRVGHNALSWSRGLEHIEVAEENQYYMSIDGVFFDKEVTRLIRYPRNKAGAYVVPAGVVEIQANAFYLCTNLTDIAFPDSLQTIGSKAFELCDELRSIDIPERVHRISDSSFERCRGLESFSVDIDNSSYTAVDDVLFTKDMKKLIQCPSGKRGVYSVPDSVEVISSSAFSHCRKLTDIQLPESLLKIGALSFYECDGLTEMTLPESLESVGFSAFANCNKLTNIVVLSSALEIMNSQWSGGVRVSVGVNSHRYITIDGVLFNKEMTELIRCPTDKTGTYVVPNSVTAISDWAFSFCRSLTNIVLPGSLQSVGPFSFYHCKNLEAIDIPASIDFVGRAAFAYCHSVESFTVDRGNKHYTSLKGVLFNKDQTELIQYPLGRSGTYTVPDSVRIIRELAFAGNSISSIELSESVYFIERNAFSGSRYLTDLLIPRSVSFIDSYAFGRSSSLSNVIFSGDAPILDHLVFYQAEETFSVYYFDHNAGFSSPIWKGYPAFAIRDRTDNWLNYFGYSIDADMNSDLDGDGVTLLAAYALGLDPNQDLSGTLPKPVIEAGRINLRYYAGAEEVQYIVETSNDLQNWFFAGILVSGPDSEGYRTASVNTDAPARFLRLRFIEQ